MAEERDRPPAVIAGEDAEAGPDDALLQHDRELVRAARTARSRAQLRAIAGVADRRSTSSRRRPDARLLRLDRPAGTAMSAAGTPIGGRRRRRCAARARRGARRLHEVHLVGGALDDVGVGERHRAVRLEALAVAGHQKRRDVGDRQQHVDAARPERCRRGTRRSVRRRTPDPDRRRGRRSSATSAPATGVRFSPTITSWPARAERTRDRQRGPIVAVGDEHSHGCRRAGAVASLPLTGRSATRCVTANRFGAWS